MYEMETLTSLPLKMVVYISLKVENYVTKPTHYTQVEYMRGETTFAVSKETKENIVPPAIIFVQYMIGTMESSPRPTSQTRIGSLVNSFI